MKKLLLSSVLPVLFFASTSFAQNAGTQNQPVKKIISTNQAPQPIGPYSQGVLVDGFLFVAGQVGVDPETRQLASASFEAETTQVLENLEAILKGAGMNFRHVVKATIYLKDLAQYAKVNEVYGKYFAIEPPARETVQVTNLPGNANVEISVIAAMQ